MESWAHEGARDEEVDSIEAIDEEGVDAEDDLVKKCHMQGATLELPSSGTR
jgi:hypothetical protein